MNQLGSELRDRYADSSRDADELAEAALDEIKTGSKGDDDAATVAVAYAVLSAARRLEIATDLLIDAIEGAARG